VRPFIPLSHDPPASDRETAYPWHIPAISITTGWTDTTTARYLVNQTIAVIVPAITIVISYTIPATTVLINAVATIVRCPVVDVHIIVVAIYITGSTRAWYAYNPHCRIARVVIVVIAALVNKAICIIVYIITDFWTGSADEINTITVFVYPVAADFHCARPDVRIVVVAVIASRARRGCRSACRHRHACCFSYATIAAIVIIIITAVIHNTIPVIINIIAVDFR